MKKICNIIANKSLQDFLSVFKLTVFEWGVAVLFGFLSIIAIFVYHSLNGGIDFSFNDIFSRLSVNGDFAIASVGIFGPIIASVVVKPPPKFRLLLTTLPIMLSIICTLVYGFSLSIPDKNENVYKMISIVLIMLSWVILFFYYFISHLKVDPADRHTQQTTSFVEGYASKKGLDK